MFVSTRLKKPISVNYNAISIDRFCSIIIQLFALLSNTLDKLLEGLSFDFLRDCDRVESDFIFSGVTYFFVSLITGANSFT